MANNKIQLTGDGNNMYPEIVSKATIDLDELTSGIYYYPYNAHPANQPPFTNQYAGFGVIVITPQASDQRIQLAMCSDGAEIYIRSRYGTAYAGWKKISHS